MYTLLAINEMSLLNESKGMLFETFEMKNLDEISFILDIEIHRGMSRDYRGYLKRSTLTVCLKGTV